jgi:hypothetical protein
MAKSAFPGDALSRAVTTFAYRPELGQQVLLREGYLYADTPELMRGILGHVRAEHMFSSPEIWIQRGAGIDHAVRNPQTKRYAYHSGPNRGRRVRVLPFDRVVRSEAELASPLHRDLRRLRNRLGFDRMRVERMTDEGVVATLRYGNLWIPTVLGSQGAELEKVCEVVEPGKEAAVQQAREQVYRRLRVVDRLRNVVLDQVREGLPFDEPKTEYGQQDGRLRPAWEQAYRLNLAAYRFQGDVYTVFTAEGRPMVPQVCLDFLLDTLDRAGGGWWGNKEQPRERSRGRFDREGLGLENPRSIDQFIVLAGTRPSQMDLMTVPPAERVEFRRERAFLDYLAAHANDFQVGDMVILRGYLPRPSDRRHDIMHFHSAYVYETDPITGVPILLAGNAGVPRLTTWRYEMSRSPRRAIHYRIRLRTDWLESFVEPTDGNVGEPPPLVAVSPYGME